MFWDCKIKRRKIKAEYMTSLRSNLYGVWRDGMKPDYHGGVTTPLYPTIRMVAYVDYKV